MILNVFISFSIFVCCKISKDINKSLRNHRVKHTHMASVNQRFTEAMHTHYIHIGNK